MLEDREESLNNATFECWDQQLACAWRVFTCCLQCRRMWLISYRRNMYSFKAYQCRFSCLENAGTSEKGEWSPAMVQIQTNVYIKPPNCLKTFTDWSRTVSDPIYKLIYYWSRRATVYGIAWTFCVLASARHSHFLLLHPAGKLPQCLPTLDAQSTPADYSVHAVQSYFNIDGNDQASVESFKKPFSILSCSTNYRIPFGSTKGTLP